MISSLMHAAPVISSSVCCTLPTRQELADLKSFFSKVIPAAAPPPIPDDLGALSAKELKEILKCRGVDFSDCYEKSDLVAKCQGLK